MFLGDRAVTPSARENLVLGVTFSPRLAPWLGLDPAAVFADVLDRLAVRHVRLPAYWDEVEPSPNLYDFTALDHYLGAAQARGASVLLSVGYKQPRWPECYPPSWAAGLPVEQMRQRILKMIEVTVGHTRRFSNISMWQVENEPLRRFGDCGNFDVLDPKFLTQEITLIEKLDQRPVLVTDSGELSTWVRALRVSHDYFGTTLYRQRWFAPIGFWQQPLPAWSYTAKDRLTRALLQKDGETILVELQSEAWFDTANLADIPAELQRREFPAQRMILDNVEYARRTQFRQIYLWGVEWWYWMEAQGFPEYGEAAQRVFASEDR